MIEALISSKTRIKLLLKLFLNSDNKAYLRGLEEEFQESTNGIRMELNRFEQVGMITSDIEGNKKYFRANKKHPLFADIQSIVKKHIGIDSIIENVLSKLGEIEEVYLTGDFAKGINANIIDLEMVGIVDENYLITLIKKVEPLIKRKVRYIIYSTEEYAKLGDIVTKKVLIWGK
jgi:hypothetical protein